MPDNTTKRCRRSHALAHAPEPAADHPRLAQAVRVRATHAHVSLGLRPLLARFAQAERVRLARLNAPPMFDGSEAVLRPVFRQRLHLSLPAALPLSWPQPPQPRRLPVPRLPSGWRWPAASSAGQRWCREASDATIQSPTGGEAGALALAGRPCRAERTAWQAVRMQLS
jgi:hypothetical protein